MDTVGNNQSIIYITPVFTNTDRNEDNFQNNIDKNSESDSEIDSSNRSHDNSLHGDINISSHDDALLLQEMQGDDKNEIVFPQDNFDIYIYIYRSPITII